MQVLGPCAGRSFPMPALKRSNIFSCKISLGWLWSGTVCPTGGGLASLGVAGPAPVRFIWHLHSLDCHSAPDHTAWCGFAHDVTTRDTRSAFCVIKEFAVTNLIRGFCHEEEKEEGCEEEEHLGGRGACRGNLQDTPAQPQCLCKPLIFRGIEETRANRNAVCHPVGGRAGRGWAAATEARGKLSLCLKRFPESLESLCCATSLQLGVLGSKEAHQGEMPPSDCHTSKL